MDERVAKYLARLEYTGSTAPTLETLAALQAAHLTHVPYETLDVYYHRESTLAIDDIYDKIVERRRGGYCFELNGLFAWLLRELGFRTEEYFGRWLAGETMAVPARRHRVIKVFLPEGEFIPDVGVGRMAPRTPFKCVLDQVQTLDGQNWRIVQDPVNGKVIQSEEPDGFKNYFAFDECPQQPIDFAYVHYYLTHHPKSIFLRMLFVHIQTAFGRNSIGATVDPETAEWVMQLNVSQADGTTRQTLLRNDRQLSAALKEYFGITFDCSQSEE